MNNWRDLIDKNHIDSDNQGNQLTYTEYAKLNAQYSKTPQPGDGFMPSGEHYILIAILNELGYYPNGRNEAYKTATDLLSRGYNA